MKGDKRRIKIACASDIHGNFKRFGETVEKVETDHAPDEYVLAGDIGVSYPCERSSISQKQYINNLREVFWQITKHSKRTTFVPGNHDAPHHLKDTLYKSFWSMSAYNIDMEHNTHMWYRWFGVGGGNNNLGWAYEWEEEDKRKDLLEEVEGKILSIPRGGREDIDILVSHVPPYRTLDHVPDEPEPIGSGAVRKFYARHEPALCVSGHVHCDAGVRRLGDGMVLNCGSWTAPNPSYRITIVTLDDGRVKDWEFVTL